MNITKCFTSRTGGVYDDLRVAFVCAICAVLPYYATVYSADYQYSRQVQIDLSLHLLAIIRSLGEEALYRLIPLALVIQLFGVSWWFLIPAVATTSTFFALGHHSHHVYVSLLAIGPVGVLLAIAFLYFGGLERNYLRGFLWCSAIHVAINVIIFVLVPLMLPIQF